MADSLQKGIQVVQQAVQNDTANNYLEAIRLYRMALDHFQTALSGLLSFLPSFFLVLVLVLVFVFGVIIGADENMVQSSWTHRERA
jgi:hypothetical protein